MWVEVEGSRDFRDGTAGGARLVRTFHATVNDGEDEAEDAGYSKGDFVTYRGRFLEIVDIAVRNAASHDVVTITWQTPGRMVPSRSGDCGYNDGKIRVNGEEEWCPEADMAVVSPEDGQALKYDGNAISASTPGVFEQPGAYLVWRKWFDKDDSLPNSQPHTLPRTKAKAIDALKTYLPGETPGTKYETGGPVIMYVLDSSDFGKKLLCVQVYLEEDGDLVCRVARFKWKSIAWDLTIYGTPT